jgi:hypothetical protein
MASGMDNRAWVSNITGAPTVQVILQYLDLWEWLHNVHLIPGVPDSFIWRWSADRKYSAASTSGAMFIELTLPFDAKLI